MSDSQLNEPTVGSHGLSPTGRSRLSGLLAGLDRLADFQSLPVHPAAADPPLPFGRFFLRSRLGAGAHGVALLADDPLHNRQVAVKVPQPAVLADDELSERFVREARAAGSLEHPGIVSVFESGVLDGVPFLVAGYVPGPTLGRWLADHPGPVLPLDAVRFVAEIATAVQHAHERGVLHCDLTPMNVLLHPTAPAGDRLASYRPAVTDFGLARLVGDDPARTRTFRIAGTPRYMAPEQVRGERRDLTARADVYSLGAILYQLATGRPPFDGTGSDEVMQQVLTAAPAGPRTLNPHVSRDLAAVCLMCLDKDPQQRYPTAAAFADDLSRFLAGLPVAARRLAPFTRAARWVRRNPWRAAAAATVCGLGVALASLWATGVRHAADLRAARARAEAGEFVARLEQVRQRREDREADWPILNLADLRHLATAAVAAEHQPLLRTEAAAALAGIDLGVPRAVAEGVQAYAPAFSADGKRLALGSWLPDRPGSATVRVLDPATGVELRTLSYPTDGEWEGRYAASKKVEPGNIDGCRSLAFSPDGRWLVLGTRSGRLVRWDLSATDPVAASWRHAPPRKDPREERIDRIAFTPGGRALASSDGRQVAVWDTGRAWVETARSEGPHGSVVRPARFGDPLFAHIGRELRPIHDGPPHLGSPLAGEFDGASTASGPAAELLFSNRSDTVAPFMIAPVAGGSMPPFVVPGEPRTDDGHLENIAVSPDGLYLATAVEHLGHLKLWSIASGELLSSRTLGGGSLRLAFAPDGRTLAVCVDDRTLLFSIPAPPVAALLGFQAYPLVDADLTAGSLGTTGISPRGFPVVRVQPTPGGTGGTPLREIVPQLGNNNAPRIAIPPHGGDAAYTAGNAVWVGTTMLGAANFRDMAFGRDGRLWIAAGNLVGIDRNRPPLTVPLSRDGNDPTHPLSLATGEDLLVAGLSDGTVAVVDPRTGAVVDRFAIFDQATSAVGTAGKGGVIAGGALGSVRVIDTGTGRVVSDLPAAHRNAVLAVAAGPAGWFATGSRDRTVKVWDPASRPVFTLHQSRPVRRLFWSEDGLTLTILAEGERGLRRWDLARLKVELAGLGLDPRLP